MMELYPLYSSSSGNMYLIKTDNSNILVDIGVTYKKVKESLGALNLECSDIDAIFITHEHIDHIKGLVMFVKNNSIPVYASHGTCLYLKQLFVGKKINCDSFLLNEIIPENMYNLNDMSFTPFNISHDAVDPVGYTFKSNNKCITIATDLGVMTDNVFSHLKDSSLSIIESNYDKDMLFAGNYPFDVKRRIEGSYGHLSNLDSGQVILKLAENGNRNFILSHLSQNNNLPILAKETVLSTLSMAGFNLDEFNISLASKDFSTEVYSL